MQVSPVPASDEVCSTVFSELLAMRGFPRCEKCWIQESPVPASDEVCPPPDGHGYELVSSVRALVPQKFSVEEELMHVKHVEVKSPHVGVMWKFGRGVISSEFKKRICQSKYYDEESVKCLLEGILEEKREEREKQEIKEFEERRLARERELERVRAQLSNKLNENKLKAVNRIKDLANVCILSGKRTAEVSEPVNKCRPLINPVVNKSVENATSCDFEKKNCGPPSEMDKRFPPV
ncbi:hypothetical protein TNCV_3838701 [Trichonephila clavipes]|nr:hypothetical protein TNCV_3838701 [Trichonephila clavipes]